MSENARQLPHTILDTSRTVSVNDHRRAPRPCGDSRILVVHQIYDSQFRRSFMSYYWFLLLSPL